MTDYNERFGRQPANVKDLHRKLTAADDLDELLAWREARTVTRNLTLHYDRMMLLLEPTPLTLGLMRKQVEVVNHPDGRFAVQFEGVSLPYRVFDKILAFGSRRISREPDGSPATEPAAQRYSARSRLRVAGLWAWPFSVT